MEVHDKPILVFDGDCRFCRRSVNVLRQLIGDRFKAVPFQRPGFLDAFTELDEESCREEIKLILSEDGIYGGAEAAFRLLLRHPAWRFVAWIYFIPPFGWISDQVYEWIAERRHCMIQDQDSC